MNGVTVRSSLPGVDHSQDMRICLVSQEYPPETARGGIGTQTWNKARALTDLGHEVHVLSSATSEQTEESRTEKRAGVMVHRIRPPGEDFPVFEPSTYCLGYSWLVLRRLRYLMENVSFDIINFPEYGAEGFAFQLDRTEWNWVPIIVQLHGPLAMFSNRIGWPDQDSDHYRVATFMEQLSIQNADWLMASSRNIADFTAEFYGVSRETISVVHCGIDTTVFCPTEERHNQHPTILFVGNLTANKGLNTAFEAVMRLRSKYPDILLRIAGKGDDDLTRSFQRRAGQEGAGQNIEFLGFIDDRDRLPELYRQADVFCSPAQHEVGVANVYVEAMACGCPVVASITGGAPEAVIHGETGLLVPPGDVEATVRAVDEVLRDPGLRQRMGNLGRRRAVEYFASDQYIRRVLAAYQMAIARSQEKLEHRRSGRTDVSVSREGPLT